MPGMMKNQPMKDSYVGGLEKSLADKVSGAMKRQLPPNISKKFPPKPRGADKKKMGKMVERMYKMPGR